MDDLHFKQSLEAQAFERFRNDPANQDYVRKGQALSQSGNMAALQELEQEVQKKMQPVIEELFGKIPSEVKQRYANWGGTPSLDNNYTVFGKLISGYNVLNAIENEPTGSADRPKKMSKSLKHPFKNNSFTTNPSKPINQSIASKNNGLSHRLISF